MMIIRFIVDVLFMFFFFFFFFFFWGGGSDHHSKLLYDNDSPVDASLSLIFVGLYLHCIT